MDHPDQKPFLFDSEKVDRLVKLALEEVLRDQNLYQQYLEKPDIWLCDVFPEILIKFNQNKELVPHENLETKDILTLTCVTYRAQWFDRLMNLGPLGDPVNCTVTA